MVVVVESVEELEMEGGCGLAVDWRWCHFAALLYFLFALIVTLLVWSVPRDRVCDCSV